MAKPDKSKNVGNWVFWFKKNVNYCYHVMTPTYFFDAKPFCLIDNNISKSAKSKKKKKRIFMRESGKSNSWAYCVIKMKVSPTIRLTSVCSC